jgi:hypothetical protein
MAAELESEEEQDRQIEALRRLSDVSDQRADDLQSRRKPRANSATSDGGAANADASV